MDLIKLRNEFLLAVAEHPIHPWPGPPPGMENRVSASYMGEHACKRKAYYRCLQQIGKLFVAGALYESPEPTPESAGNEIAAQRGWILEDSVRTWLSLNGVEDVVTYEELMEDNPPYVLGPDKLYYGHPDGYCTLDGKGAILEIKHQNAMRFMDILRTGVKGLQSPYYAQVQAYMLAAETSQTLFIALSSDPSSVKGDITWAKRRKDYQGQMEADFCAVPNCSGVNPFVYVELVPADKSYQKSLVAWASEVDEAVDMRKTPERTFDIDNDWQCRQEWCEYRALCERYGGLQVTVSEVTPQVERGVSRE